MKKKIPLIEVCAPSIDAAIKATLASADRMELCHDISCGGVTPSREDIEYCIKNLNIKTNVLLRPRAGNFVCSDEEFEVIKNDLLFCKSMGVNAVVVGFLNNDNTIDVKKTTEIVKLAHPMEVTFHRAFDECADWKLAIEQIIACGCSRILTSGQKDTAVEGAENIKNMVLQADNRIIILAGSGITMDNYKQLVAYTGVREIHGTKLVMR